MEKLPSRTSQPLATPAKPPVTEAALAERRAYYREVVESALLRQRGIWRRLFRRKPARRRESDSFFRTLERRLRPRVKSVVRLVFKGSGKKRADSPVPRKNVYPLEDYLPVAKAPERPRTDEVAVDIVLPVYRGKEETLRCLRSVLSDPERCYARLLVINDCSPDAALTAALEAMAKTEAFELLRNEKNLGFVRSVNRGMAEASPRHDVLLLNSDTEVPTGWLQRMIAQAHAGPRIGTVTPFSNNATICSYPSSRGGPLAPGQTLRELDEACAEANPGRHVGIPTAVGFCMYIRRDCLDDVGLFDAEAFGRGYGEENDFCLRATERGWTHLLACDVFVYHVGEVSFGAQVPERQSSMKILLERYPHYPLALRDHFQQDPAAPYRFALTASLLRRSERPVILLISHDLGGGTARQIGEVTESVGTKAHFLLLRPEGEEMTLSVPGAEDHPVLTLGQENRADLLRVIRTCGVSRVHLHHWIGFSDSPRHLIHELGLPFDFTVHDYYAICPQITLTSAEDRYCGEPDAAGCNRCLAEKPGHPATDIVSWRREHQWLFREADRVICPSEDVRRRLQRYGLSSRALVVPHERWREGAWPLRVPAAPTRRKRLRVGIIGAINQDKGQAVINACVPLARREGIEFFLIGHMKDEHACRIPYTGPYDEADLPGLIEAAQPHLLWFSAVWPETYSYTLSAALASGLPIIAPKIGAFTERLEKRPWSWLVDLAGATPETWIKTFLAVREALPSVPLVQSVLPVEEPGFYETDYLGDWAQPRRAGENLNAEVELSPT